MRSFNKVFVIALPRCATVSLSDALGMLNVTTAHLGRIYGEKTQEHNNPERLQRMHEQIVARDFHFDVLESCDGLADYPACCFDVMRALDQEYPRSLFINARREGDRDRWLQSVERQFVGLQLLKTAREATPDEQAFMRVMLSFREMTFGQSKFDADCYALAYERYQNQIDDYFSKRQSDLLDIDDIQDLDQTGFSRICSFLDCAEPPVPFPCSNKHSECPSHAFMQALESGAVASQTGIRPVRC